MNEKARQRVREIMEAELQHAKHILALMEKGLVETTEMIDGERKRTTDRWKAERKAEIANLTEALEQLDKL